MRHLKDCQMFITWCGYWMDMLKKRKTLFNIWKNVIIASERCAWCDIAEEGRRGSDRVNQKKTSVRHRITDSTVFHLQLEMGVITSDLFQWGGMVGAMLPMNVEKVLTLIKTLRRGSDLYNQSEQQNKRNVSEVWHYRKIGVTEVIRKAAKESAKFAFSLISRRKKLFLKAIYSISKSRIPYLRSIWVEFWSHRCRQHLTLNFGVVLLQCLQVQSRDRRGGHSPKSGGTESVLRNSCLFVVCAACNNICLQLCADTLPVLLNKKLKRAHDLRSLSLLHCIVQTARFSSEQATNMCFCHTTQTRTLTNDIQQHSHNVYVDAIEVM